MSHPDNHNLPEGIEANDLTNARARGDFVVGQSYDEEPCSTLLCTVCGNDRFIVGVGHCFTAIKCPNCKYEICIHDG